MDYRPPAPGACNPAPSAVSRYKAILGVSLSARTVKNQKVEAAIKCAVLNRMAELGMPRSERVY